MSRRFLTYETEVTNNCVDNGVLNCDNNHSGISLSENIFVSFESLCEKYPDYFSKDATGNWLYIKLYPKIVYELNNKVLVINNYSGTQLCMCTYTYDGNNDNDTSMFLYQLSGATLLLFNLNTTRKLVQIVDYTHFVAYEGHIIDIETKDFADKFDTVKLAWAKDIVDPIDSLVSELQKNETFTMEKDEIITKLRSLLNTEVLTGSEVF